MDISIGLRLFVGVQDSHLCVIERGFRLNLDGRIEPIMDKVDDSGADHRVGFMIGRNQEIYEYIDQHPDWNLRMDYAKAAEMFVNLEIANRPNQKFVGRPYAVLLALRARCDQA